MYILLYYVQTYHSIPTLFCITLISNGDSAVSQHYSDLANTEQLFFSSFSVVFLKCLNSASLPTPVFTVFKELVNYFYKISFKIVK